MDDERDSRIERLRSIVHRGGAIRTELALLALIIGTVAATCNLLLAIHRHAATTPGPLDPPTLVLERPLSRSSAGENRPVSSVSAKCEIVPQPARPVEMLPTPEDPTKKVLAGLTKATALEVAAAQQADRRASALASASDASDAESRRWKRREMLVRQQITGLTARADQLESAASILDAERDVLAKERDALKAALAKAGERSGYSVLPYKGPNGTWRRPIVLDCTSGGVKLLPKGPTFTAMDLSPLINPRSSPVVRAIANEMLRIRGSDTPDGSAAVPYLVFLVRPGGIRHYYEARTSLEPLGIAFGYELIEQDLVVDIPDYNDLATWDGSVPLDLPLEPAPRPKVDVAMNSQPETGTRPSTVSRGDQQPSTGWPGSVGPGSQPSAGDSGNGGTSTPEDFVWPTRGRQIAANAGRSSVPSGLGGSGGLGDGGGSRRIGPSAGAVRNGDSASFGSTAPSGSQSLSRGGSRSGSPDTRDGESSSGPSQTASSGRSLGRASEAPSEPRRTASSGATLRQADEAPSEPGQTGSSSGSFRRAGEDGSTIGSSASGPYPGGGAGSAFARNGGGSGSSLSPGGGAGSGFGSGKGIESNATTGSAGGAIFSGSAEQKGVPGSGADASVTGGGLNALPDLEPAVDGGASPPLTTTGLEPSGRLAGTGFGAGGGPTPSSSASQAAAGIPPPGDTASPSAAGDLAALPYPGQSAGSLSESRGSDRSSGDPGKPSGTNNEGGQPLVDMNDPGGLKSPGQALASAASSAFGTPTGIGSSPPSSSSSSGSGTPSDSGSSASSSSSSLSTGLGTPSGSGSSASAPSSSSMGGMPIGSPSSDSSSSSSSSLSLGQSGSTSSESSSSDDFIIPRSPKPASRSGSIEIPYEIVVVCRRNDVLLHPGGYRLTTQALEHQGPSKDGLLAREIVAMVRKRAIVDPLIRPKPKIKFLVETDGADTFWTARRQLLFSLPDWPMSLHVSGPQGSHVFTKETW